MPLIFNNVAQLTKSYFKAMIANMKMKKNTLQEQQDDKMI